MKYPKIKITEYETGLEHSLELEEALQFIYNRANEHSKYSYWCVKIVAFLALFIVVFLIAYLSYKTLGPYRLFSIQ